MPGVIEAVRISFSLCLYPVALNVRSINFCPVTLRSSNLYEASVKPVS
ncbi:hypothetical protein GGD38_003047 [Chitinophagaceae bacterium OAS944]|nr:hypothetical protein [Chitinophagaceae bacterium OAS944]